MKKETTVDNIDQLPSLAAELLEFAAGQKVFAFIGNLGLGKTTFIKTICKQLKYNKEVQSPTFSIINEYSLEKGKIYHIDLYRIEQFQEVENLGLYEILESGNYCFIEWPQIAEPLLPESLIIVKFELLENMKRKIEFIQI